MISLETDVTRQIAPRILVLLQAIKQAPKTVAWFANLIRDVLAHWEWCAPSINLLEAFHATVPSSLPMTCY